MSFKCPSCGTEITAYTLAGVYLHPDKDLPHIEKTGSYLMRISGRFKGLAMLECPRCGMISFLNLRIARSLALTQTPSDELYPKEDDADDE